MITACFRFYAELNDFLPPSRRKSNFAHSLERSGSIKDAIEALGVPHTEIDLILVNGESVDFSHPVQDGDQVSVYPVFESLDITPLVRVRPRPLRETRFVVDTHLGKLATYRRTGESLPVPGGYAESGELTKDADKIMASGRVLPMGFWKGSGLALVLDLLAALLSNGLTTADLSAQKEEHRVSQVFLAFRVAALRGGEKETSVDEVVAGILAHFHTARPATSSANVYHPGQRTLERRAEARAKGAEVDSSVWAQVLDLLA